MGWLSQERYEAEFATETSRLAGVVAGLDPSAAVPTCPGWTVRDLVTHVGGGHRWATTLVAERLASPQPRGTDEAPEDPAEWTEWLTSGAGALADAVREVGADCPVWTWQRDRTAGFWLRRMLHDELVHRFDADLVAGGLGDVAADLAADGVSDMLETAATLSRLADRPTDFTALAGAGETLRFAATDCPAAWIAERATDGVTWHEADGAAGVSVSAPVRELLLLLNRRIEPSHDGVEVTGYRPLLDHWLQHTKF
jgi:uncharacterized protein (TIGR03083 family)